MLKHYKLREGSGGSQPFLLWETRLDIQDVRSGFRGSDLVLFLGPFLQQADVDWSEDLVKRIDLSSLEEIPPPEPITWPAGANDKLIRHLLKHHRIPLWRNYSLATYSAPEESKEDFIARCLSTLSEERTAALQKVQDVFLRRFLEIEGLLLEKIQEEDSQPELQERMLSGVRDLFSEFRDDFSRCFLKESLDPLKESDLDWTGKIDIELQERILKLRADLVTRYNQINDDVKATAESVDKHEVTLSYQQIQLVSKGILWRSQD